MWQDENMAVLDFGQKIKNPKKLSKKRRTYMARRIWP
jgi:hypothetical protein